MLREDIKNRMRLLGLTNRDLSDRTGATQSQLSLYLTGTSESLRADKLQKCLDILGINTSIYTHRYEAAMNAANMLDGKFSIDEVMDFSREKMATITEINDITLLLDVDEETYRRMIQSNIVDVESTYPFFKSMVMQLMGTKQHPTRTSVLSSLDIITRVLGVIPIMGLIAAAMNTRTMSPFTDVLRPLKEITEYLLRNKNK